MGYSVGFKGQNRVPDQTVTLRTSGKVNGKVKHLSRKTKMKGGRVETGEEGTIHSEGGYNNEAGK